MKTFKTFFEEGIALKRDGVPFGHIYNQDKDGNIINLNLIKDVEKYKRERDDAVETKISTGHGKYYRQYPVRSKQTDKCGNEI